MFFFSVRFLFALAAKANSASYSQTSSFYCCLVAADLICTLTGPSLLTLLQAKSPSLSQSPGEQIFGTTSSCSAAADFPTDPQQNLLSGRVHQNQSKGKLSLWSHFPVVLFWGTRSFWNQTWWWCNTLLQVSRNYWNTFAYSDTNPLHLSGSSWPSGRKDGAGFLQPDTTTVLLLCILLEKNIKKLPNPDCLCLAVGSKSITWAL